MVGFISASNESKSRKSSGSGSFFLLRLFVLFLSSVPVKRRSEEQRNDFTPDTAEESDATHVRLSRARPISSVRVSHDANCGSHLDPCAVEVQHLGSHSLYAAHDLLLMAHQRDPQAHHVTETQEGAGLR